MSFIDSLLEQVTRSADRLLADASALTDAEVREPSALPGWTRGQVLVHVARSADAYTWLLRSASGRAPLGTRPGTTPPPSISEAGAELAADLRLSLERFLGEARAMPADAWDRLVTALAGWRHPAWFTLRRCLRELHTHHVDLHCGYRTSDWPDPYVAWALDDTLATLKAQRFPLGLADALDLGLRWELTPDGPAVAAAGHVLLGWLAGRAPGPGQNLPTPPTWPQPPTPGWGQDRTPS
ncbi:maleylpyruvate isomerase family mycothiol-dependent enzyme [Actinoallomurus sp. NPDC050550]|uniref:maleylpyruvate isomerase family mycothiol-dependent enzyme n=1 Tax=Actinoallomurus sp. NPDC050550 TaxID=3154937 RepID=UPI0033EA855B